MTPPPIRYPLPTLLAATVIAILAWRGEMLSRPLRASLSSRWEKATAGPTFPSSERPLVVAGPFVRRALPGRDGVIAAEIPGGKAVETFRLRMLVDVYDLWPLSGPPTHYRVGNRRPVGWVEAADVLPWDTRLVVQSPSGSVEGGGFTRPVLGWDAEAVRVADWRGERPWAEVARVVRLPLADLPEMSWGVWLSREELLTLLRRSLTDGNPKALRLRRHPRPIGGRSTDRPGRPRRRPPGLARRRVRGGGEAEGGRVGGVGPDQ